MRRAMIWAYATFWPSPICIEPTLDLFEDPGAWFWELEEVFVVFFAHILKCFLEVNGGFDQQAFMDLDDPLFIFWSDLDVDDGTKIFPLGC